MIYRHLPKPLVCYNIEELTHKEAKNVMLSDHPIKQLCKVHKSLPFISHDFYDTIRIGWLL